MNIMLNSYCNLSCPYCFADNEINLCEEKTMSEENFDTMLDFLIKNNIREVRIIGGEPTLHPYFIFFLEKIVSRDFFERIHIFSNMNFGEEVLEPLVLISKKIRITLLPNFNSELITKVSFERIVHNIKVCSKYFLVPTIGVNLYDPNMDLEYFYNILDYFIKEDIFVTVRWAITVPSHTIDKNFKFKEYFNSFYNLLISFFKKLNDLKIPNRIDCNSIPMCAFSQEELCNLIKYKPDLFAKPTLCNPVLDVNPKLEVFRCFGLSNEYKTDIKNNENMQELMEDIVDNTKELSNKTVLDECKDCEMYKINNSSCSCVAYRKWR